MPLIEIIKERRSVRRFQAKEIPEEIIQELIEALIWAPSAGNLQSRKFYFVFNQDIKEKVAKAAMDQKFIAQAFLVVVGCTNDEIQWKYGEKGKNIYTICDVAMAIQNMILLAYEKGLGTCPVGLFNEEQVSEILNIPKNLQPILIIPVGYPDQNPSPPERVSLKEAIEIRK
jgi:nitroreductase